jgi:hypothetical protein
LICPWCLVLKRCKRVDVLLSLTPRLLLRLHTGTLEVRYNISCVVIILESVSDNYFEHDGIVVTFGWLLLFRRFVKQIFKAS